MTVAHPYRTRARGQAAQSARSRPAGVRRGEQSQLRTTGARRRHVRCMRRRGGATASRHAIADGRGAELTERGEPSPGADAGRGERITDETGAYNNLIIQKMLLRMGNSRRACHSARQYWRPVEAAAAPRRGRAVAHDGADCVAADRTGEQPSELRVAVSAYGVRTGYSGFSGVWGTERGVLSGKSGSATVGPCVVPQVNAERMWSLLQVAAVASGHCCKLSLLHVVAVACCRCCMLSLLHVVAVASCRCCMLSLLHVVAVASCRCCMLSLLQAVAVACCRCCMLSLLHVVAVACCRCCMLSLLQAVAVACCRCCKLSLLHVVAVACCRCCMLSLLHVVAVAGFRCCNSCKGHGASRLAAGRGRGPGGG